MIELLTAPIHLQISFLPSNLAIKAGRKSRRKINVGIAIRLPITTGLGDGLAYILSSLVANANYKKKMKITTKAQFIMSC